VEHKQVAPASATWWKREHLVPGLVLLALTAVAWAYTLSPTSAVDAMTLPSPLDRMSTTDAMAPPEVMAERGGLVLFLLGWAAMMVAMMLPAALPLVLLYRTIALRRLGKIKAGGGMVGLLAGYLAVWAAAGLPVYAYSLVMDARRPLTAVVPSVLLIAGGAYQFTALKQGCHTRCSNPLFFLMHKWRPGVAGAMRLGMLHGLDCLGCCLGLMLALVALGMMHLAWMLTAAVIIFMEKTMPGGHRVARPLGIVLIMGGVAALSASLLIGQVAM
jgi:predicted metal-binding membrane protein